MNKRSIANEVLNAIFYAVALKTWELFTEKFEHYK